MLGESLASPDQGRYPLLPKKGKYPCKCDQLTKEHFSLFNLLPKEVWGTLLGFGRNAI